MANFSKCPDLFSLSVAFLYPPHLKTHTRGAHNPCACPDLANTLPLLPGSHDRCHPSQCFFFSAQAAQSHLSGAWRAPSKRGFGSVVFPLFLCSSSGGENEGIGTTEESIEGKQHQKPPLEPLPNVHQDTHTFRGMHFPVPIKALWNKEAKGGP